MRRCCSSLPLPLPLPTPGSASPLAVHQNVPTLRPALDSSRRSSAGVGIPQNSFSSQARTTKNDTDRLKHRQRQSGPTVRKKEAQLLSQRRQQLASSLSGKSPNLFANGDDLGQHDAELAKQLRSIHLASINNAYRSSISTSRPGNKGMVKLSNRLSTNVVASVRNRELVDGMDAGGQSVGGGLSVPNQPKPHDFVGTHISLVINSFLIVMFFTNAELITLRI